MRLLYPIERKPLISFSKQINSIEIIHDVSIPIGFEKPKNEVTKDAVITEIDNSLIKNAVLTNLSC